MFRLSVLYAAVSLSLICASFLYAYWPTTVQENMYISHGSKPSAVQLPEGRTLVVHRGEFGNSFNIIDKYGEFQFPGPQTLTPAISWYYYNEASMIPDGFNGAIVCWSSMIGSPIDGIVAQRLDSLGNLIWGDSGIVVSPFIETDFDICPDGEGGFFLAVSPNEGAAEWDDLYAQHIDASGNLLWGPNGVLVVGIPNTASGLPRTISDNTGGCFIVWEDSRPPYSMWGGLFAQRLGVNGNRLWNNDLDLEAEGVYFHQMLPDGAGGFLLHTNPGGDFYNTVYRVSPTGNILWQRYQVSSNASADIIPGDNLYFYLAFGGDQGHSYYAQKMDMQGNTYWPTFGSLQGALMANLPQHNIYGQDDYTYSVPYFYGIISYKYHNNYPRFYLGQKLNTNGIRIWGNNGILMTSIDDGQLANTNAVYDGYGGLVLVYEKVYEYDIYAKRLDYAGRLGGALHLLVDLEAQNPPVQIPPGGGRFHFNIALEDTYSVSGIFDAWIEVTLPNGQDLEILHRDNITIQPNSVIQRSNLTQVVPGNAPAGTYIYHLYVGNREYDDVWAEDSFEFVKLGGAGDSFTGYESKGFSAEDWKLTGFFEDNPSSENESGMESSAGNSLKVYPNPSNAAMNIRYSLSKEAEIKLSVYDLNGREIAVLREGSYPAGEYEAVWDCKGCSSGIYFAFLSGAGIKEARKMLLLK